jgi:malonate transporter and related proteins
VFEILTALAPLFAIIILGFVLRHLALISEEFWLPSEKINYFYLFPALMFSQIATADYSGFSPRLMAIALLGAVAAGAALLYVWRFFRPQPGPVFSSILQGGLRPNTYVGVAAASALYGKLGLMVTAIAIAITIPVLNVLSIVALSIYSAEGQHDVRRLVKTILVNPVILSVLAGAVTNYSGVGLPKALAATLTTLGGASLPLGLLAVGAGLDPAAARNAHGPVFQSSVVKLTLVPFATYAIGVSIGLHGIPLSAIVLFNALPCTPSVYIMARLLGGDHRIAAGIISVQTVLAAITIPLVLIGLTVALKAGAL